MSIVLFNSVITENGLTLPNLKSTWTINQHAFKTVTKGPAVVNETPCRMHPRQLSPKLKVILGRPN